MLNVVYYIVSPECGYKLFKTGDGSAFYLLLGRG